MPEFPRPVRVPVRAPVSDGLHMPAEWEPHAGCLMAWPSNEEIWPDMAAAEEAYAATARAIAGFEPVTMLTPPARLERVRQALGGGIELQPCELDDSWTRDTAPTFVVDDRGGVAGVDWVFNGWGRFYTRRPLDETLAQRILEHLDMRRYATPFILEGGAFHVDGRGTLLVTEQCMQDPERNSILGKKDLEELFAAYLGVRKVIWLGEGLQGDDTRGHVDIVACFARPGLVLLHSCHDPSDANHGIYKDNLRRLQLARDAEGRELEVVELPQPEVRFRPEGGRMDLSYVNFYIANGGVVLSRFGDPQDVLALETIKKVFDGRQAVQVDSLALFQGGGGIHCITQQVPVGRPLERF